MQEGVFRLMADAGIQIRTGTRNYRPTLSFPDIEAKILKPQNIIEMLHAGSRDLGFAGADWVAEKQADLIEILDTGLDPIRLVAAAPKELLEEGKLPKRHLVIASEYESLSRRWIAERALDATFVRTYGATEVFPPEDADCIIDNTATGSTLRSNGLQIVDELMTSSTRLYLHPRVLDIPAKREMVEHITLLLRGVLEARTRVMVEINVSAEHREGLVAILPCMREPTISTLHGDLGYAIKVAVPKTQLTQLIPKIRAAGGTDIVITSPNQIIP
jgi:ATP phosphoribosyltransferase